MRDAKLDIKLIGNLKITVKREALWSVYGPAVRTKGQTYAVRYGDMGTAGIWEQLYQMNKATNLEEWQDAMRLVQLPMFNTAYADKDGNIYYVYNGAIPIRNENYDWTNYLPGDTSETLWTDYLPYDDLPQVLKSTLGLYPNCKWNSVSDYARAWQPRPKHVLPHTRHQHGLLQPVIAHARTFRR